MNKAPVKASQKQNTDVTISKIGADKSRNLSQKNDNYLPNPLGLGRLRSQNEIQLTPDNILFLQRTIGNQAVAKLIQAKLKVGQPEDQYEQEADRIADQVMTMPEPETQQPIQRQSQEENEIRQKSLASSITPLIKRQEIIEEEEDLKVEIQTKPSQKATKGEIGVNENFENRLSLSKRGGSLISDEVRAFVEPRMKFDFSKVRVHTDNEAAQMNQELGSRAFTHGRDIYFGVGQYKPQSIAGKRLMAHELTHVLQQTSYPSCPQSMGSMLVIQRWGSLGEEYYNTPPHTEEGVGIIAGVPEPGEGEVFTTTNLIFYGDQQEEGQLLGEAEWRAHLGSDGDRAAVAVYGFLRTALLDDAEWLEHVRRFYDGNPAQSELAIREGVSFDSANRRVTRPTEEQQMALAKAIYLRGRSRISFDFDRYPGLAVLMERFLVRFQSSLIERMARENVRFGAENVEAVTRAASHRQQATMVGSAAGTLIRAIAKFSAWDVVKRATEPRSSAEAEAEQHKMHTLREAEMAGQLLRGVADEAAEIRREQIDMWKGIIGIAMAAIPVPGVGQFVTQTVLRMSETALRGAIESVLTKAVQTLAADRVKDGLAAAFADEDFTERIQDIRTEVVWSIREFELGDEEDDFVNTVNATLVGSGH